MTHRYKTRGTCSREITFDLEDGVVKNIRFQGGCNGNTKGIATLAEGMEATELIRRLQGLDCNGRGTSCPDQLAKAVQAALQS